MMGSPRILVSVMLVVVVLTAVICSMGLKKGVESITKFMMMALLALMVILGIRSLLLPGAMEGISFYLKPNLANMEKDGIWNAVYAASTRASLPSASAWAEWKFLAATLIKISAYGRSRHVTALIPLLPLQQAHYFPCLFCLRHCTRRRSQADFPYFAASF